MLPLDDVKQWLKITGDTHDAQIQTLIDRAVAIIERETLWYFRESRPAINVLDGSGTDVMFLRQPALAAVVVETRGGPTDTWVVVPTTDYEVNGRELLVGALWKKGRKNFRATYDEGFDDPPGDVCQLILDLVAMKWQGREENLAFKSERIGDYAYTRADLNQLDQWRIVENNWRRLRI